MKFNRKIVTYSITALLTLTGCAFLYDKYQGFLPTEIQQPVLTTAQIEQIKKHSPISEIRVYKSQRQLQLIHQNQVIRNYTMRLGFTPEGHKQQEGDGKTPEGRYEIDWRNAQSVFYKSLHISYPNTQDRAQAQQRGISPGGDIMIHGSSNGPRIQSQRMMQYLPKKDWTLGCISVRNNDIDEIWQLVKNKTPITIYP